MGLTRTGSWELAQNGRPGFVRVWAAAAEGAGRSDELDGGSCWGPGVSLDKTSG